jgi:xylulose-5-phosphate/fructose-6-phosphate phosphoketolase
MAWNLDNFRMFEPDVNSSNRLQSVLEVTGRTWNAATPCSPAGAGLFSCYEAFIHVVDSMFNQHAKWLTTTNSIPWRRRSPR